MTLLAPAGTTQKLAGIDWYDGSEGYIDGACPCLAIGYQNGRVQIMRNERDDSPVLIDACMKISALRWSPNGTVLAIAGSQVRILGGLTLWLLVWCGYFILFRLILIQNH